jgi:hypothetical protein
MSRLLTAPGLTMAIAAESVLAQHTNARMLLGAYSERCRSAFRGDGDRDSELMPIAIPR